MKIFFIGKFHKLHDEEYIARSFEMLGHTVVRCPQVRSYRDIAGDITKEAPDVVLFTKWEGLTDKYCAMAIDALKRSQSLVTVCWLFDLFWGYPREHQVATKSFFKADFVFTTDDGHAEKWKGLGINHICVRQGIFKEECFLLDAEKSWDVIFVGSPNPLFQERIRTLEQVEKWYGSRFAWFGKDDTDETRGVDLNVLFSKAKVVIGDSVPSPRYWSNRVVETLGRGGFLIHQGVGGIREEYPDLVTYRRGNLAELKEKIDYFIEHDAEREVIRFKNFELVRDQYTMDKKCAELLKHLCPNQ